MNHKKIRIAKLLANYNFGSRREIEKLILEKKIIVNNQTINNPVIFASENDEIFINKRKISFFQKKDEIYKFYKPQKIICSKSKQDHRSIIYEILPKKFKNFIFAGRLDFLSEGLIIITNSSKIARNLELPQNQVPRIYVIRAYGNLNLDMLQKRSKGTVFNKIKYQPFLFRIKSRLKKNTILEITLREGKKNEIREIFKSMDLQINKLKRIKHGPFHLGKMKPGEIKIANQSEVEQYENYFRN